MTRERKATKKIKWACPECSAPAHKHGNGSCIDRHNDCDGLICECGTDDEHTAESPCPEANCYHCGWGGTFPVPAFDPAKLKGWAKQAWAAGWRPPTGWTP